MKIQIIFLAVLGLAFGNPLPTASPMHDFEDFMRLVPTSKLLVMAMDYLHHDQEVKEFVEYIQSEEFPMIHSFMEHMKEYTEMKVPCFKFFNEHGFDVYEFVHHLHHLLHMPPYEPNHRTYMGEGLHGFFEDMHSVLPLEEMKAHLHEKMESRYYLKMMVKYFHSPAFKSLMEEVQSWPEYHKMHEIVRERFRNMHHIHELLKELYRRGMHMFKHEMMEFIPIAKVLDMLMDYMNHDPEMKEFFVYIQSEEFPMIHRWVEHMKKYKEMHMPCMEYIDEHGIDFYAIVHELHRFMSKMHVMLGMPHLEPTHTKHMGFGLPGFMEDIASVFPLHELKEHFKMLYRHMHSHEFMEMMHVMPEYHEMVEFLRKIRMYHRTH